MPKVVAEVIAVIELATSLGEVAGDLFGFAHSPHSVVFVACVKEQAGGVVRTPPDSMDCLNSND